MEHQGSPDRVRKGYGPKPCCQSEFTILVIWAKDLTLYKATSKFRSKQGDTKSLEEQAIKNEWWKWTEDFTLKTEGSQTLLA